MSGELLDAITQESASIRFLCDFCGEAIRHNEKPIDIPLNNRPGCGLLKPLRVHLKCFLWTEK